VPKCKYWLARSSAGASICTLVLFVPGTKVQILAGAQLRRRQYLYSCTSKASTLEYLRVLYNGARGVAHSQVRMHVRAPPPLCRSAAAVVGWVSGMRCAREASVSVGVQVVKCEVDVAQPRHPAAYSIRQHTSAYVGIRQHALQHTSSNARSMSPGPDILQHTAYVSIRRHTPEYVSIRRQMRGPCRRAPTSSQLLRCQYLYSCASKA
jgi:hypothetical protein